MREKRENGTLYLEWECPHEFKTGRECGKKHWVEWSEEFDSVENGVYLYCPRHQPEHES